MKNNTLGLLAKGIPPLQRFSRYLISLSSSSQRNNNQRPYRLKAYRDYYFINDNEVIYYYHIHISYIYFKEESYMKIFSVCARVDYQDQDVIDLGLFKSSKCCFTSNENIHR